MPRSHTSPVPASSYAYTSTSTLMSDLSGAIASCAAYGAVGSAYGFNFGWMTGADEGQEVLIGEH